MNVQKQIQAIIKLPHKEQDAPLRELARKIGVTTQGILNQSDNTNKVELIRRIQEADRCLRESRTRWFAFVSAIASIVAALAAWWIIFW